MARAVFVFALLAAREGKGLHASQVPYVTSLSWIRNPQPQRHPPRMSSVGVPRNMLRHGTLRSRQGRRTRTKDLSVLDRWGATAGAAGVEVSSQTPCTDPDRSPRLPLHGPEPRRTRFLGAHRVPLQPTSFSDRDSFISDFPILLSYLLFFSC